MIQRTARPRHITKFFVAADNPEEVEAPEILSELDMEQEPVCPEDRWVYDGHALRNEAP